MREQTDGRYAIVATVNCGYFRLLSQHCWSAGDVPNYLTSSYNYIFKKLGKMTWAWGSRQERVGKRQMGRGCGDTERENGRKKEKERSVRTVLSLFKCFSRSIKMYWALRQQPKSSSKLYVEKTGIIPQVSTIIYNNMNESWFWQSSIYLMKNLLKREKKV